jgi:hypothetical protein
VGQLIGWGWVYALSARNAIERGRLWQAENYVSAVRDHALGLACVRHGEPHGYGRGFDNLPAEVLAGYESALVRSADADELRRALAAATERFLDEIAEVESELAERLRPPLNEATGAG